MGEHKKKKQHKYPNSNATGLGVTARTRVLDPVCLLTLAHQTKAETFTNVFAICNMQPANTLAFQWLQSQVEHKNMFLADKAIWPVCWRLVYLFNGKICCNVRNLIFMKTSLSFAFNNNSSALFMHTIRSDINHIKFSRPFRHSALKCCQRNTLALTFERFKCARKYILFR